MGNTRSTRRAGFGFTLVELLVVIAIIAVLASIIFPVFLSAIRSAHRSACAHNLMQIAQGVALYQQDGNGYPPMYDSTGIDGIPQGGVCALAHVEDIEKVNYFWCVEDPFPTELGFPGASAIPQDNTASSYEFGYNYYGYVTTTTGMPFPITTPQAFVYFMGNPQLVDTQLVETSPKLNWDLNVVKPNSTNNPYTAAMVAAGNVRPAGLFQGLWNNAAPRNTIITFCPNHFYGHGNGSIPVVMLSGEIRNLPIYPPMAANQTPDPGDMTETQTSGQGSATPAVYPSGGLRFPRYYQAIGSGSSIVECTPENGWNMTTDWRINQAPFPDNRVKDSKGNIVKDASGNETYNNNSAQSVAGGLYGDSMGNATATDMPLVVQTHFVITPSMLNYKDSSGNLWYDTGISLQAHDVIMSVARGKWQYLPLGSMDANTYVNTYAKYADSNGGLWFTPDGDPTQVSTNSSPTPGSLIGQYGTSGPLPLGSRGFIVADSAKITTNGNPSNDLFLSIGTGNGATDPNDPSKQPLDKGWCEVWVAFYRPS